MFRILHKDYRLSYTKSIVYIETAWDSLIILHKRNGE